MPATQLRNVHTGCARAMEAAAGVVSPTLAPRLPGSVAHALAPANPYPTRSFARSRTRVMCPQRSPRSRYRSTFSPFCLTCFSTGQGHERCGAHPLPGQAGERAFRGMPRHATSCHATSCHGFCACGRETVALARTLCPCACITDCLCVRAAGSQQACCEPHAGLYSLWPRMISC